MTVSTRTNPGATDWRIDDEVIQLREWGGDVVHQLAQDRLTIGTAETCTLRLVDRSGFTSHVHARLEHSGRRWMVRDLGSRNGTRIDGARRDECWIEPGVELGIGGLTLLAESHRFIRLRSLFARVLGYEIIRLATIDRALRSIRAAATRRLPLVLCGPGDLIPVAQAIHRHVLGEGKPFVLCDPRRQEVEANVRAAGNAETGLAAMQRATGGSLCVWSHRLPADFKEVGATVRGPSARVQLIVCSMPRIRTFNKPYVIEPIMIPALSNRGQEVRKIVDECAEEAFATLGAPAPLTEADRGWIVRHSASSLGEIEKGTARLLAIRQHDGNLAEAARSLGMAPISLTRWLDRRTWPDHRPRKASQHVRRKSST